MAKKPGMPPPPQRLEGQRDKSSKQVAREAARKRYQQEQRRNLLLIIAGVAIVGLIAVVLISNAARSGGGIARTGKGATLGAVDAPVVLQDFSDFYCSHCRDFALDRAPALVKDYVDQGLLRIEFKHFPLRASSYGAHIAAECAAGQDKFWEYHDLLFKNQQGSELSNDKLKTFAADAGLQCGQGHQARSAAPQRPGRLASAQHAGVAVQLQSQCRALAGGWLAPKAGCCAHAAIIAHARHRLKAPGCGAVPSGRRSTGWSWR